MLQAVTTNTSEKLIHLEDRRITDFLATSYDCSKQYNLRQFNLTRVQNCTQVLSETEYTKTLASVFIKSKAKRIKASRCSATIRKTRVFCAQGAYDKYYRHSRMDWHAKSMNLPKNWTPMQAKFLSETLMVRIALDPTNIFLMALSLNLIDSVFKLKLETNKRQLL